MKKLFYVALAALVLVSCGGDNKETKQDTKKETTKKDAPAAQTANKTQEAVKENVEEVATIVDSLEVSTNPECATEGIEPAGK